MEVNDSLANPGWTPRANDVVPPVVSPVQATPVLPKVGVPVRGDGDTVYLIKGGKKHWFATAEAYAGMGFKFGDEVKMDQESLDVFPEGEPIK